MSLNIIVLKEKPNVSYYLSDELKVNNPVYFTGTAKTIRKIIEKKNIPETEYIYATTFKKEWKLCDPSCKKGKLLLTKNWCDTNNLVTKIQIDLNINKTENKEDDKEEENDKEEDIFQAPEILLLQDHEKFRDSNGKIIEIETRGEKSEDKIYFKVTDVSVGFQIYYLKDALLKEDRGYQRNIDYVTFNRIAVNDERTLKKPSLYLTYNGFLRVLFVSRNENVKQFRKWAEKILFTCQFGNETSKEELGTSLLNINTETYRNVFKTHTHAFPCVYLEKIGIVKDLKDTFNIDEIIYNSNIDNIICKFGFTDDIERRLSEHQRDYGRLKNVNLELLKFTIVETKYKVEAEQELRKLFQNFNKRLIVKIDDKTERQYPLEHMSHENGINDKNRYELVILNKTELETVFKYYKYIGNEYAGSTAQLQNKIEEMKHENEKIKQEMELERREHENILLKKEMKIQELEHITKYKELELKMKEMELLCLKNNIKN
jgi:hypothetical protein